MEVDTDNPPGTVYGNHIKSLIVKAKRVSLAPLYNPDTLINPDTCTGVIKENEETFYTYFQTLCSGYDCTNEIMDIKGASFTDQIRCYNTTEEVCITTLHHSFRVRHTFQKELLDCICSGLSMKQKL